MNEDAEPNNDDTNENETTEIAIYRDCAINLPLLVFGNQNILASVLNYDTWALLLDDEERDHLRQYLPHFPRPQETYHLQEDTVQKLLSGKNFKFGNPVLQFQKKLQKGYFNPRIAELLAIEQTALHAKYKLKRQEYYKNLLSEVLLSRRAALHDVVHSHTAYIGGIVAPQTDDFFTERQIRLQNAAQLEYEKIWLSVKISTQDYSNSSDEEETFEDRLNRHKESPKSDSLCLKEMLNSYRKRRNSHILYPDLITEKVTLLSVRHRVEKKKRRLNEIARRKAMKSDSDVVPPGTPNHSNHSGNGNS